MVGLFINWSAIFESGGRKFINLTIYQCAYTCGGRNIVGVLKFFFFNEISYNPLVCSILAVGKNIVCVLNFFSSKNMLQSIGVLFLYLRWAFYLCGWLFFLAVGYIFLFLDLWKF